ncbi:DUF5000 domain-containing lipoprotein [Sphingobacterium sp. Mn56C]|uniref:DUF5000 domain-containing lipoprotein n=1 Tax=Sphingobacterium sp. Mn56C TaxID=3395261 RepID=UPI003BD0E877
MKDIISTLKNVNRSIGTVLWVLWLLVLLSMQGCKEELANTPSAGGQKPMALREVQAEKGAGKSTLTFVLKDENALYVMAQFEIRPGVAKEAKVSKYQNKLVLDGFARAGKYPVKLYAVGEGEIKSDPLDITVDVDTPPVMEAFETLNLREDFGGLNVSFINENQGDLSVDVLTKNNFGAIVLAQTYYSSQKKPSFSVRGFQAEAREFYVVIRDRWKNISDTAKVNLVPLQEDLLDRTKIKDLRLPTDVWQGHTWSGLSPREIRFMFDGNTTDPSSVFHVPNNIGVPLHFTIDLGKKYQLSRFKMWMRNQDSDIFNSMSARLFDVYGSNEPDPEGSWDGWTLIGEYEAHKPSGLPRGELSAEDRAQHTAGLEFDVPIDYQTVRYLRFRIKETWGMLQTFSCAEMAFWGIEDK